MKGGRVETKPDTKAVIPVLPMAVVILSPRHGSRFFDSLERIRQERYTPNTITLTSPVEHRARRTSRSERIHATSR